MDIEVKLTDFGLSGLLDPRSAGFRDFMGSDDHMAPEIITLGNNPEWQDSPQHKHEIVKGGTYDAKVDVWALGIIMYNLFMGETPFDDGGEGYINLHLNIIHKEPDFSDPIWQQNPLAKDFVCNCLVKDPEKRTSSAILCEHPYMQEVIAQRESFKSEDLTACQQNLLKSLARYSSPNCTLDAWQTLCFLNLVWLNISHSSIQIASRVFRTIDSDKNGIIEREELMDYVKKIDGYKEVYSSIKAQGATKKTMN